MAKAVNIIATTYTAECPCGGAVMDATTWAYMLTGDTTVAVCDTCSKRITFGKTARLAS